MIAGVIHPGSGLGDQLHRYITVRTLAEAKGYEFGMLGAQDFKGASFMSPPMQPLKLGDYTLWKEKEVTENGIDVRSYDPEINFVEDNTVLDGTFEDIKYWGHNLSSIKEWLHIQPRLMADNLCVIGFRGGEYAAIPELFLPLAYYLYAIGEMRKINPDMQFEVHTDDKQLATQLFPDFPIFQDIGLNWRSTRYAKYAIIANSAFYILPRNLKHHEDTEAVTIAPRYWARRNLRIWARPSCYYPVFRYV